MTFEVKTCNDLPVFVLTRKLLYPLKKKVRNQINVTFKQYVPVFFQKYHNCGSRIAKHIAGSSAYVTELSHARF